MRRSTVILVIVSAVIGGSIAALAQDESRSGFSGLDFQVFKWKRDPSSTASTRWADIPGMHDMHPCLQLGLSATVSVVVRGGPIDLRVNDRFGQGGSVLRPGAVRLFPRRKPLGQSFTFVRPIVHPGAHTIDVQWRSPTGTRVTLRRGDVNLLYQSAPCTQPAAT